MTVDARRFPGAPPAAMAAFAGSVMLHASLKLARYFWQSAALRGLVATSPPVPTGRAS